MAEEANGMNLQCLFWNTARNPVLDTLYDIIEEYQIDVVLLAEYAMDDTEVLARFNGEGRAISYNLVQNLSPSLRAFYSNRIRTAIPQRDEISQRYSFFEIEIDRHNPWIVAIIHNFSKVHDTEDERKLLAKEILAALDGIEKRLGHNRSILIGDFNADPYEASMLAADSFHAVPDRSAVRKGTRTVKGTDYRVFYNPSWKLFYDSAESIRGTYFFDHSGRVMNAYWHVLDQIFMSAEAMDCFRDESLRAVTQAKGVSLLSPEGRPDKDISDHLPICFSISSQKKE